jgi:AhpD family alkylhydroperoxidase
MQQRINLMEKGGAAVSALLSLNGYLAKSGLEENLLQLINFRVSQINGCAYCLDMHSKDLRAGGETEQRIYLLAAWRESPFYKKRERAALSWAEAVTLVGERHVPDDVYDEARKEFSEAELIDLTLAVIMINGWNRLNIAFHTEAGSYQPGLWQKSAN